VRARRVPRLRGRFKRCRRVGVRRVRGGVLEPCSRY
jgi:hypothetical protein